MNFLRAGMTESKARSDIKQKLTVPFVSNDICADKYKPFISKITEAQVIHEV